jgi:hypothetical protein
MENLVQSWKSHERHYTLTCKTFTKSELRQDELQWSILTGSTIQPRWSRQRLQNEAKTLQFIASNTAIPVPKVIGLYEDKHGLLHLEMERARGIPLDEIDALQASAAVKKVDECLKHSILPELHRLRSCTIGSVDEDLPLVPPSAVTTRDKRHHWGRASRPNPDYRLCHLDLGRQNIFVDPDSFQITDIIDWEYAGFFPVEFERQLWLHHWNQPQNWNEQIERFIYFLDNPGTFVSIRNSFRWLKELEENFPSTSTSLQTTDHHLIQL